MNNELNIFGFINSTAIAEHCRNIKHSFSTLDMAYLIWASEKHSIKEKHNTWHKLINTQPDMEVPKRPWTPYIKSLHAFLHRFMELENKYLTLFYKEAPCCVYSYSIWYPGDKDYSHEDCFFSSFRTCYDAIKQNLADIIDTPILDLRYIRVEKRWISRSISEVEKTMTIYIDSAGSPWFLCENHQIVSEEDRDILDAFRGMWPEIPTPFKRGDILMSKNRHNCFDGPFVLDAILYWEEAVSKRTLNFLRFHGDESDLDTNVYWLADDGTLCRDHGPCYLDMEYYDTTLDDSQKFLAVLGGFIKGEYDVAVLLEAYDYLKDEKRRKLSFDNLCTYNNPCLIAAGFKESSNGYPTT